MNSSFELICSRKMENKLTLIKIMDNDRRLNCREGQKFKIADQG